MGARVYGVGARVYGAGARVYGVGARVYGSLVIIVSAPVQRIGFWGFSVLVRTFVSGLRDCWDGGLGLGLGLDNKCYVIPLLYLLAYCLLVAFYINLLDFDMNLICNSLF